MNLGDIIIAHVASDSTTQYTKVTCQHLREDQRSHYVIGDDFNYKHHQGHYDNKS